MKLEGRGILWMEPRKLQGLRPGAPRFSLREQGAHTLQPGTHWRWLGETRWGRGGAVGVEGAQVSGAAGGKMLDEHLWRREKPEGDRGQRQCLPVGRIWRMPLYQDLGKREPALSHFSFEDKLVFLLNGS